METNETNNTDNLKQNAKSTFEGIKVFLSELLDVRQDTDKEETIETIKTEISFKGHNAWILIFSVFVASIGLNVSSAAVVIGAMLISPLMGPIVGVGLSVAINDIETLRRSLINLGIMIGLSILTAYLYFLISPLTKLTPELEARTYPTILDVLVAIFGGLALIVAKTKKGTMPSVIYGVAIATALMPPLCTAGYGLAVGNFEYFVGAFYLFTINSIFIALSAFVVSKLLGFPLVKYANSQRRKRIAQIATAIAVVVMVPSTLLFWKLLKQEIFLSNAEVFISENLIYEDSYMIRYDSNYDNKTITVYMGGAVVPKPVVDTWESKLLNDNVLKEANLLVRQGKDDGDVSTTDFVSLSDRYSRAIENNELKDNRIRTLEMQISNLTGDIPFQTLIEEVRINYRDLTSISFSNILVSNFKKIDTIPVFTVAWNNTVSIQARNDYNEKLKNWLSFKLGKENVEIREQ